MDELIKRVKATLKSYGITTEEELFQAISKQKTADIGIFLMPCRMEDSNVENVS